MGVVMTNPTADNEPGQRPRHATICVTTREQNHDAEAPEHNCRLGHQLKTLEPNFVGRQTALSGSVNKRPNRSLPASPNVPPRAPGMFDRGFKNASMSPDQQLETARKRKSRGEYRRKSR